MDTRAPGPDGRQMPETQWSRLVELADRGDPRYAERLETLLRAYWKPIYHYVRAMRTLSTEDAEDLTQGFFATLLARIDFGKLSRDRGSFRGFLKAALRNHVVSTERKTQARVEGRAILPLSFVEAESAIEADHPRSPDEAFERAWAQTLLAEAQRRLREEMATSGKEIYFRVFEEYCLDGDEPVSYESVAARHGLKVSDVRNYLYHVRQRGRELVRELVRDYLLPGESVEDEVRYILGLS